MRNNICTWVGFDVRVQAQVCLPFLPLCEGHTIRDRQVSMIKVLLLRHLKNGSRLQFWWVRATYAQSPRWFQTWTPQVWCHCNLSHFNTHLIWIPSIVLGSLGIHFALAPVGFHGFRLIFLCGDGLLWMDEWLGNVQQVRPFGLLDPPWATRHYGPHWLTGPISTEGLRHVMLNEVAKLEKFLNPKKLVSCGWHIQFTSLILFLESSTCSVTRIAINEVGVWQTIFGRAPSVARDNVRHLRCWLDKVKRTHVPQHQDHQPHQTLSLVAMTLITHPLITLTHLIQKTTQGISDLKSILKKKLQDLSSHMISQIFRIWSVMGATHLGYQRPSGNLFIGWAHLSCRAVTSISS